MSDRSCEAKWPTVAVGVWLVCGQPATAVHRYACVHEHVRDMPTCDEHQPQPGVVGCQQCMDAGHECTMHAELLEVIA